MAANVGIFHMDLYASYLIDLSVTLIVKKETLLDSNYQTNN